MKNIKISEKEAKGIMTALENSARIFGLLRISALKHGDTKNYNLFASHKTESLLAHQALQIAYDKAVKKDD